MRSVAFAAFVLALTGCASTYVDFKPHSSTTIGLARVMRYAMRAYEGDIPTLASADGVIVGTLDVSGNGFADSDDVRSRAMEEAARAGGTHLIVAGESSSTSWAQITPDRASTAVYGNTATTTYTPGAQMPVTRHRGAFVVVRVPPERWLDLPRALRPVRGRHFKGNYAGQRRIAGAPGSNDSPHAPAHANWFCTLNEATNTGICFRTSATCDVSYEQLKQYGTTPCVARPIATCFSSGSSSGTARISCHPTIEACRDQRDYAFGQGMEIVRECTATP